MIRFLSICASLLMFSLTPAERQITPDFSGGTPLPLEISAPLPGPASLSDQVPAKCPPALTLAPGDGRQPDLKAAVGYIPADVKHLSPVVKKYARLHRVDEKLVWAVIRQESGFVAGAVSPKGAMGLMQLMPETAALLGVSAPFDPEQNIAGGVKYLKSCLDQFGQDVGLALAAYNAGPQNVVKYGGCPPFPETINYVALVMADYSGRPRPLLVRLKQRRPEPVQEAAVCSKAPAEDNGLHWNVAAPHWKVPTPQVKAPQPHWKIPRRLLVSAR